MDRRSLYGSARPAKCCVYINGLPLVVFEFKSATRENATIHDAWKQLTIRYARGIPELMKYNALCVISDGVNSRLGSLFAPYEYFYTWRKVKYTDWNQREDIKAELKVDLILLLGKHGYPPVDRDEVYKEIFEQAENFK
ncbi:type I restriction enzyme endonuclease domain-containing protein [Marinobacter subterrani]|uniref:type I site-specific deoxyribonuclease n=1 Tax=Marinobacter subterrani TaxID=1658765 RepID=A0A0J7JDD3_9GAMM|nr:type I restriction enzyme endonuclease domain-containing protein [Marinobacter subterrani]KMQ76092.1 Type I restriction enzyme R protein N terminus [Marinobacter subterrani]